MSQISTVSHNVVKMVSRVLGLSLLYIRCCRDLSVSQCQTLSTMHVPIVQRRRCRCVLYSIAWARIRHTHHNMLPTSTPHFPPILPPTSPSPPRSLSAAMCHTEISTYTCGHAHSTTIQCNHRALFEGICLHAPASNESDPLKVEAPCFQCTLRNSSGKKRLGNGRGSGFNGLGQGRSTVPSGSVFDDPAIVTYNVEHVRNMEGDSNCRNPREANRAGEEGESYCGVM